MNQLLSAPAALLADLSSAFTPRLSNLQLLVAPTPSFRLYGAQHTFHTQRDTYVCTLMHTQRYLHKIKGTL